MNKQTAKKADFFLQGILGRLSDGADFFEGIKCVFRSGTKEFEFIVELDRKLMQLNYIFQGQKYCVDVKGFCDFVLEQIPLFDTMTLTYCERGKGYIVEADDKRVVTKSADNITLIPQSAKEKTVSSAASMSKREYFVRPDKAAKVLETIGILGQNGKVRNDMIRKYNQIDHFVELLDPMLRQLAKDCDTINVIDLGCGKSYLDFVLNYYIKEVIGKRCHFTGLDINPIVIEDSKKMAAQLKYNNMEFIETDIADFQPEKRYDLLLTLHACDTATDKALSMGILNNVRSMVCVPCCHKEMNSQYHIDGFEEVLKHGVLKARIADSLTDGMRALYLEAMGYDVSLVEYISPLDTPKNLMMKAFLKREKSIAKLNQFFALEQVLGTDLSIKK